MSSSPTRRDATMDALMPAIQAMCEAYEAWVAATPSLHDVHATWANQTRVAEFSQSTKRYRRYAEKHFPERVTWNIR